MAKLECNLQGNFDSILRDLEDAVLGGSISATYEDGSDVRFTGGVRCAVRVYERFSWMGQNRVSMSVTLTGVEGRHHLTVITSGGSTGVFFKINTWGEDAFLNTIRDAVAKYKA